MRARADKIQNNESQGRSVAELEKNCIERIITISKEYSSIVILSWSSTNASYYWLKSWATQNNIAFADWGPSVKSVTNSIPLMPIKNQHSGGHHRTWVNYLIAREFATLINNNPKFASK